MFQLSLKPFRNEPLSIKMAKAIRNSIVLCCTLGLGFVVGFFPSTLGSEAQGIIFTSVNGLAGTFILLTSVNKKKDIFLQKIVTSTKLFVKSIFSKFWSKKTH